MRARALHHNICSGENSRALWPPHVDAALMAEIMGEPGWLPKTRSPAHGAIAASGTAEQDMVERWVWDCLSAPDVDQPCSVGCRIGRSAATSAAGQFLNSVARHSRLSWMVMSDLQENSAVALFVYSPPGVMVTIRTSGNSTNWVGVAGSSTKWAA